MRVLVETASTVILTDHLQLVFSQSIVERTQQVANLTGGRHTKTQRRAIAEIDHLLCVWSCGVFDCLVDRLASHSIQKRSFNGYQTELSVERFVVCDFNRFNRNAKIGIA